MLSQPCIFAMLLVPQALLGHCCHRQLAACAPLAGPGATPWRLVHATMFKPQLLLFLFRSAVGGMHAYMHTHTCARARAPTLYFGWTADSLCCIAPASAIRAVVRRVSTPGLCCTAAAWPHACDLQYSARPHSLSAHHAVLLYAAALRLSSCAVRTSSKLKPMNVRANVRLDAVLANPAACAGSMQAAHMQPATLFCAGTLSTVLHPHTHAQPLHTGGIMVVCMAAGGA